MHASLFVCDIMHRPHGAMIWSVIMTFLGHPHHFKEVIIKLVTILLYLSFLVVERQTS